MTRQSRYQETCKELLATAGIKLNGTNSHDMLVHNPQTYKRVLSEGSLGLGESYMDGWWDSQDLPGFFERVTRTDLKSKVREKGALLSVLRATITNPQGIRRAFNIGKAHYDTGNDLFEEMLDDRMIYTCAYWQKGIDNLDDAQEAKLKLSCEKLQLKSGMRIVDIGCGWGGFLKYAAKNYDIEGVGLTVSKEQAELARENCSGLPIEIRLQDYRDLDEMFDAGASLGMYEHVGPKNYKTYAQMIQRSIKPQGLFLLHTIGSDVTTKTGSTTAWPKKYIFPDGTLPSIAQIATSLEGFQPPLVIEDLHNFGADYAPTLNAWNENFQKAWPKLKADYEPKVDGKFKRMWEYYLQSFQGGFESRWMQLWQIVISNGETPKGYESVRNVNLTK
jgi:cyclopropane-fatty-acyl-phospholipid synthase